MSDNSNTTDTESAEIEVEGLPVGVAVVVSAGSTTLHTFTDEDGNEVRNER